MNLFENLQLMKESEETLVSNRNKNIFLRQIIEMISEIKNKELIPKECNKLIKEIYDKTLELRSLFDDENDIKTEAPKEFFKKVSNAKETLSHFSKSQVDFVKKAYDEVLADIGDAFVSERGNNSSKIKNDYISIAIEDNLMSAEEFETIYKALEVIGVFHANANA